MKHVLMMLVLALGLVLPGQAGEREGELIGNLLGLGVRALQAAGQAEAQPATAQPAASAAPAQPRAQVASPNAFAHMLTSNIKTALDGLIEQYKEEYKEEGRQYAGELGDLLVTRVVQDPEINHTITSLRTLCWAVVAYLTLVTLIMLGCLVYLKRANAQLLAEVRRLVREKQS